MDKDSKTAIAPNNGIYALGTHAIRSTVGSVTAGVGDVLSGKSPFEASVKGPSFDDVASPETFDKVKDYNVKTNLRVERIGLVSQLFSQFAGVFWSAIGTAAGVIVGLALNRGELAIPAMTAPIVGTMLVGALTLTLVAFAARQFMVRQQTEKGMDIADYHLKREAKFIGQEVERVQGQSNTELTRADGKAWTQVVAEQQPVEPARIH